MSPVLTDAELAELLKLDQTLVERLVAETDLPRVTIAGERRFVTSNVLTWLSVQDTLLVLKEEKEAVSAEAIAASETDTVVVPAQEDEVPFVSRAALLSLSSGASDPGQNLARQQVRDGLAALGDGVHPTLVRLSHDRLHPSPAEADRTSAWRVDETTGSIRHVTMAWAEGDGPPGFVDRPHMALAVTGDAVEFSAKAPSGPSPAAGIVNRARAGGAMVSIPAGNGPWAVTYLYEVGRCGAPTAASLQARLVRDAKTLVPLWLSATSEGANA